MSRVQTAPWRKRRRMLRRRTSLAPCCDRDDHITKLFTTALHAQFESHTLSLLKRFERCNQITGWWVDWPDGAFGNDSASYTKVCVIYSHSGQIFVLMNTCVLFLGVIMCWGICTYYLYCLLSTIQVLNRNQVNEILYEFIESLPEVRVTWIKEASDYIQQNARKSKVGNVCMYIKTITSERPVRVTTKCY